MNNNNDIWNKQFGDDQLTLLDFTGKTIKKEDYRNHNSRFSWDVYSFKNNNYIIVNSLTLIQMPNNCENNFWIDNQEYKFIRQPNGSFNIVTLQKQDKNTILHNNSGEKYTLHKNANLPKFDLMKKSQKTKNEENCFHTLNNKSKEIMENKSNKIWEQVYGNSLFEIDFLGTPIIKSEFKTNTLNSWDFDLFDEYDEQILIASIDAINKKAKRKEFTLEKITYNSVVENGKWKIINSMEEKEKEILFSSELTNKEIEKYFPSFLLNKKQKTFNNIYYSSLLINLSDFPIEVLEKLRMMLQKFVKNLEIFQDIFIYTIDNDTKFGNNCYIRIFFKSYNLINQDTKIFQTSLILKNIIELAIINIRTIFNLSQSTNFTLFLSNHNQIYKHISWFTSHKIDGDSTKPIRINRGEFLVDQFYFDFYTKHVDNKHSFQMMKTISGDVFFLCDLNAENISEDILAIKNINKNRLIR